MNNTHGIMDGLWHTPVVWREAHRTVGLLLARYGDNLKSAADHARVVKNHLEMIFPLMTELCDENCSRCQEPCCGHAWVWFDFRDLLFIRFTETMLPPAQVTREKKSPVVISERKGVACRACRARGFATGICVPHNVIF